MTSPWASPRRYTVSEFPHLRSVDAFLLEVTWEDFVGQLRRPRAAPTKDSVPLFSPARFKDGVRAKANVEAVSLFVLDVDNPHMKDKDGKPVPGAIPITGKDVGRVLGDQQGLAFAMATSWSHTPDHPKFRVVLPLARPVPGEAYRRWARAAVAHIGLEDYRHAIDPKPLKNAACVYYWPAAPDGFTPVVMDFPGKVLDMPVPEEPEVKEFRERARIHTLPQPGPKMGGGEYATLDVVAWFQSRGLYKFPKEDRPRCHIVTCPWEHEHTEKGGTGTAIFEAEGETWPSFECMHAHCDGRRIHDVMALWGDADRFCAQPFQRYSADMALTWQREATAAAPAPESLGPLETDGNAVPFVADPTQEHPTDGLPATVEQLFKRYVYVSGMGKVLDRKHGTFMAPEDLNRTLKGRKLWSKAGHVEVDYFKESARRMVHQHDLVFMPGVKVQPPRVNLFTGFEAERTPRPEDPSGEVDAFLGLLAYLCGSDVEWVLKWLAYPLKYPGAKMRSALVVHGGQGAGKSLVFDHIMRSVYGRWARKVNQSEIESGWTGFMSQRLYVVAEEVTTRATKPATSGLLKDWVTAETIAINQKNLPIREERNACNFVFLSNESVPLLIDKDDRRYMVIRVPSETLERSYFLQVVEEWKETRGGALYHYLREFDVGPEFIHQPVPVNRAKLELKEACRSSHDAFLDEWACIDMEGTQDLGYAREGGDLRLPYGPALYSDLYKCYRHWCHLEGLRPVSTKSFSLNGLKNRGHKVLRHTLGRYVAPYGAGLVEGYALKAALEAFESAARDFVE